jgi:hypothetical protein
VSSIVYDVHKIHLIRSEISDSDILSSVFGEFGTLDEQTREKAQRFYRFDNCDAALVKYYLNIHLSKQESTQFVNKLFLEVYDEALVHKKLYMSSEEIKQIANLQMLGSHCHSHLALGKLSDNESAFELERSRDILTKIAGYDITMVSYPYGNGAAVDDKLFANTERIGYKYGFTTIQGINKLGYNAFCLNRFDCNDAPGGKNFNTLLWR